MKGGPYVTAWLIVVKTSRRLTAERQYREARYYVNRLQGYKNWQAAILWPNLSSSYELLFRVRCHERG